MYSFVYKTIEFEEFEYFHGCCRKFPKFRNCRLPQAAAAAAGRCRLLEAGTQSCTPNTDNMFANLLSVSKHVDFPVGGKSTC